MLITILLSVAFVVIFPHLLQTITPDGLTDNVKINIEYDNLSQMQDNIVDLHDNATIVKVGPLVYDGDNDVNIRGNCRDITNNEFKNIVFEGGGSKAIAYIGALKVLHQLKYYHNARYTFKHVGGASAGCLMAYLIALDIDPNELEKMVHKFDMLSNSVSFEIDLLNAPAALKQKSDESPWYTTILQTYEMIRKASELADLWLGKNSPGLSVHDRFVEFVVDKMLPLSPHYKELSKFGHKLNFRHFYKITGHTFSCFVTDLNAIKQIQFNHDLTPNDNVYKAMYASISIPGIFKPLGNIENGAFVDGGLLGNLPMHMADVGGEPNMQTLALSLSGDPNGRHKSSAADADGLQHASTKHDLHLPDNLEDCANMDISAPFCVPPILGSSQAPFHYSTISTYDFVSKLYKLAVNRDILTFADLPMYRKRIIYLDVQKLDTFDHDITNRVISNTISSGMSITCEFFEGRTSDVT